MITKKENHSNGEMAEMLTSLEKILEKATGMFGYATARNARELRNGCMEFLAERERLAGEYGNKNEETGEVTIDIDSENFRKFVKLLQPFSEIRHDVEITRISHKDLPPDMNALEILQILWMVEDSANEEWLKEATGAAGEEGGNAVL